MVLVYLDSALTDFLRLFLFFLFFCTIFVWPWLFCGAINVLLLLMFWLLFWLLWLLFWTLLITVLMIVLSLLLGAKFTVDLLLFTLRFIEACPMSLDPFYPWVLLLRWMLFVVFFWKLFSVCKLFVDKFFLLFYFIIRVSTFLSPLSSSFSFLLFPLLPGFSLIWMIAPRFT